MVTVTGGANIASDNTCAAGSADTMGISVAFTIADDGFFTLSFRGLGLDDQSAVLIWSGDADLTDACSSWAATSGFWSGFMEAGDYTAVITSNNGAADACGEFSATLTPVYYDAEGVTDTWVAPCNAFLSGFWAAQVTFTPAADGFFNVYGVGRQDGVDTGSVFADSLVLATADLPTNFSSAGEICNATDNAIAYDVAGLGYPLVAGTEYTFLIKDADTDGEIMVYVNFAETVDPVYPDCDNMDYADQADWSPRPNIPAVSVVTECTEDTSEYYFDVRHSMYDTEVFVVVDTVGCGNPDDDRSDVDGAIALYYGHKGSERTADAPAVAPEACEDFIIAGDSGDGGAVFYWFPANAGLTLVPTTYSSGASGVYWLSEATYDIVGCVPANPFLPVEPTGGDSDNAIVAVVSSVFFLLALF